MPSKTQMMTIALTIGVLAVLNRVEFAKEAISGNKKFLGLF
jgi:hypothetical protein